MGMSPTGSQQSDHDAGAWIIRPFRDADAIPVVHLHNASWTVDGIDGIFTEKDLRLRMSSPKLTPSRHAVVVDGPPVQGVPEGTALGFGLLVPSDDQGHPRRTYNLTLYVHPIARASGMEQALMERLLTIALEHEAREDTIAVTEVRVKATVYEKQEWLRDFWADCGMEEVRQFWVMHRPLSEPIAQPPEIEGVVIRPYNRPTDNKAGVLAYNDSFRDHYDYHEETEAEWDFRASMPVVKPELSRVAEATDKPGEIVGFCVCAVFDHENQLTGKNEGWIALLGTTRAWRGKGLGRALLLHGLHALKEASMKTAVLGVDTDSLTGADRLYRSVGFHVHERTMHYQCSLAEIIEGGSPQRRGDAETQSD